MHQSLYTYFSYPEIPRSTITPCIFQDQQRHPTLPLCLRHEVYQKGTNTGEHQHLDFYALYIVQGGKGIHMINQRPYPIARGDVYLLPLGASHRYTDYHQLEVAAFYFQLHIFTIEERQALRSLAGFWHLLITLQEEVPLEEITDHRLHLSPERHGELTARTKDLGQEYLNKSAEASILTRNQFFSLLVALARWQEQQRQGTLTDMAIRPLPLSQQRMLAAIVHYCEEHFHEPLTVPQLAAMAFLSPGRFSEIFLQELGVTPAAYIRSLRLERAQTLLRTSSLSTTQIAHEVGFRDSAQFARTFRATFHCTPTEYRSTFQTSTRTIPALPPPYPALKPEGW